MLVTNCGKEEALVPATVLGEDVRTCPMCGGWFIQVDTNRYRTEILPEAFRKENTPVYIRFQPSEKAKDAPDLIDLTDIRPR